MLRHLVDYAEKLGLPDEPGFAVKDIRWAICFSEDGRYIGVSELGNPDEKRNNGIEVIWAPDLSQPELVSGKAKRSHFLIESASVVALHSRGQPDTNTLKKHDYFIYLLRKASEALPELANVARTLADKEVLAAVREQLADQGARPNDNVTVMCGQTFPVDDTRWHDWWRRFRAALARGDGDDSPLFCDIVTGESITPAATHPKVKGLASVGGQSTGSPLISFDKDAFTSYGLDQSANCAVSEPSAAAYCSALNHLVKHSSQPLGGMMLVHWFKERVPAEDNPLGFVMGTDEQDELDAQRRARELLEAIRTGERPDLGQNYFYAMTMSGTGGRVMVRDWMEGQFETLVDSIDRWFSDLEIVRTDGTSGGHTPGLPRLVTCLLPPKRRGQNYLDWVKPIGQVQRNLWRAAAGGEQLARAVHGRLLPLLRAFFSSGDADEVFKFGRAGSYSSAARLLHARMGLLRAYHVRNSRMRGDDVMSEATTPYLNEQHPSAAYHCGRLMAILAKLQQDALGDVGAGVVQRYYAAASTTPALVLGRLTRTSQFHLSKVAGSGVKRKRSSASAAEDNEGDTAGGKGLAHWYESKIGEVYGRLGDDIPKTLTPEEQSLFALGYYQQLVDLRTSKKTTEDAEGESKDE